jgi:CHAD domain-containing protein
MKQDVRTQFLDHFKKEKRLFEEQAHKTARQPTANNVHNLRVTTRRLQAVLWLAKHGSPKVTFRKLATSLRKLGQALGEKREVDVAIADAARYRLKVHGLKSRQRKAKRAVLDKITSPQRKKISQRIGKALRKIKKRRDLDLTKGFSQLSHSVSPYLNKHSLTDNEAHKLRIAAKRVRYALRVVGKPVPALRDLQDCLGRGHDLVVLQELTKKNRNIQNDANKEYTRGKKILHPALAMALKQMENIVKSSLPHES